MSYEQCDKHNLDATNGCPRCLVDELRAEVESIEKLSMQARFDLVARLLAARDAPEHAADRDTLARLAFAAAKVTSIDDPPPEIDTANHQAITVHEGRLVSAFLRFSLPRDRALNAIAWMLTMAEMLDPPIARAEIDELVKAIKAT